MGWLIRLPILVSLAGLLIPPDRYQASITLEKPNMRVDVQE